MPIFFAIIIVFLLMFILGVDRGIITLIALGLLLIFSVACVLFFLVSFIILLSSKMAGGRFAGFMYTKREEEESVGNRLAKTKLPNNGLYSTGASDNGSFNTELSDYGRYILTDEPLKNSNRIAFAAYYLTDIDNSSDVGNYAKKGMLIRNLFPTDDIMTKLYKRDEELSFRVCRIGKKQYAIDGVTKLIIFIGLPVFSIITGIIVPLIMQYAYIFIY